jgi:hypothetical protein
VPVGSYLILLTHEQDGEVLLGGVNSAFSKGIKITTTGALSKNTGSDATIVHTSYYSQD